MNSPADYLRVAKLPTPRQLSEALGVDDPSSKKYLTIFATDERHRWATSASLAKARELDSNSPFWNEFASLYLPTFIRAWREVTEPIEGGIRFMHDSVLSRIVRTGAFATYLRTHPDAHDLFPFIVKYFGERAPWYEWLLQTESMTATWRLYDTLEASLHIILHGSSPHSQASLHVPQRSSALSLANKLKVLVDRFQEDRRTNAPALKKVAGDYGGEHLKIIEKSMPMCILLEGFLRGERARSEEETKKLLDEIRSRLELKKGRAVLVLDGLLVRPEGWV